MPKKNRVGTSDNIIAQTVRRGAVGLAKASQWAIGAAAGAYYIAGVRNGDQGEGLYWAAAWVTFLVTGGFWLGVGSFVNTMLRDLKGVPTRNNAVAQAVITGALIGSFLASIGSEVMIGIDSHWELGRFQNPMPLWQRWVLFVLVGFGGIFALPNVLVGGAKQDQTKPQQKLKSERVRIDGEKLAHAQLQGANLKRAKLEGKNLRGANLQEADLQRANLTGANMRGARLCDANLRNACLERADLSRANLCRAILENANLRNAVLRSANLKLAFLVGSNMQGAELKNAKMEGAELSNVTLDSNTVLPDGNHYDPASGNALLQRFTGLNPTKDQKEDDV